MGGRSFSVIGTKRLILPSWAGTGSQMQTVFLIVHYINLVSDHGYAKFYTSSHDAVIGVYDEAGNVSETHEHKGDFKEP